MCRHSFLTILIMRIFTPVTGFFIIFIKSFNDLFLRLIFLRISTWIMLGIIVDIFLNFFHLNTIKVFFTTVIMFNLAFSTVIFVAVSINIRVRISLSEIWIKIVVILPDFIISIILINLMSFILKDFWLRGFLSLHLI